MHLASGREWRGGQRQTCLLASELTRRSAAAPDLPPQLLVTGRDGELARRAAAADVPVRAVSWRAGLDARVLPALLRLLRPGDILHAHDPHALALGALASRWRQVPLVVTRRAAFPLRRPALWRRPARVVAISEAVRQQLVADGIEPERIAVIPSAITLDATRRTPPAGWRARLGLGPRTPLAVCVAALTKEKGHRTLLEAAARLQPRHPQLRWALAGAGPLESELRERAGALGIAESVLFLGHVAEPLGLIAEASVFVLPSESEGFGSSLLDAMALRAPIVASRAGGIPEIVAEDAGCLVAPGRAEALARAVHEVIADPDLARRLADAAEQRVEAFDVPRMAERHLSVYRSIANSVEGS